MDDEDDGMPMIFATDVLKPPPGRIGRLSRNIVLPRTVSVASLIGGILGGIVGLIIGVIIAALPVISDGFMTVFLFLVLGAGFGSILAQWKPWRGEGIARVAFVRFSAWRAAKKSMCPGTGLQARYDADLGVEVCLQCRVVCEVDDSGLTKWHQWRRRVYFGIMEVNAPASGVMEWISGSVPVRQRKTHPPVSS